MASPPNAGSPAAGPSSGTPAPQASANIITALNNAFRQSNGEPLPAGHVATMLIQNMSQLGNLVKEGKLSAQQIAQLKDFVEKHQKGQIPATATAPAAAVVPPPATPAPAVVPAQAQTPVPAQTSAAQTQAGNLLLSSTPNFDSHYATLASSAVATEANHTPVAWPPAQQGRPTLTGGMAAGRMSGTPALVARSTDDPSMLTADDARTRRKNTPGDQSMRRSIQDLVSSIDPNVKIEAEVEELLLDIADEFIDSVTNFACRLAKHRGAETLEVKDLQLHLERNHNIRIPGFASDETRLSLSQTGVAPAAAAGPAKKGATGSHMTLRSHRLAQVQQAKREGKLL